MKTHTFTLVLGGVSDVTPELADALYEATQGDIEFKMRDGVAFLEVARAAPTRRRAIASVIREVENAGIGVRVVRVSKPRSPTPVAKINALESVSTTALLAELRRRTEALDRIKTLVDWL